MRYEYKCEKCGGVFEEFRKIDERDTVNHCGKKAKRLYSTGASVLIDSRLKDSKGNPIWYPKEKSSYFDRALQKTFYSKKHKYEYMRENRLIMDGSDDNSSKRKSPEAGTTRKCKPIYC